MAAPKIVKDFEKVVDEKLPEIFESVAKDPSLLAGALDSLLALEKKTRLAADAKSTLKLVDAILVLLFEQRQWKLLNDHIALLCKRRAQLKQVVKRVIQRGCGYVDKVEDPETKLELVTTLRTVSMGKIFVELERAQMTRIMSQMEEAEGHTEKACDILHEIAVETVGSMDVDEKLDFLLDQVRLCLECKDFVRSDIIAKKVRTDVLEKPEFEKLKLKYYRLMIEFYQHSDRFFDICKAYMKIFHTPSVQADPALWQAALRKAVLYLVLSPFDAELSDLLQRIKSEKQLEALPNRKLILDRFSADLLMKWPMEDMDFKEESLMEDEPRPEKLLKTFRKRIIQHNIRVLAAYYTRITTERLTKLLEISAEEVEDHLAELVTSKQLYARMDRPAGIVSFVRRETPNSVVNEWTGDVTQLLGLVEKTCHLINKEFMLHKPE